MSYKEIKQKNEGFTIIEVLIVLAIAALIMLIVFLAIPQLRKNQQNTAMRNEASRFLTAATEFESNSNGVMAAAADVQPIYAGLGTLKQLNDPVTAGNAASDNFSTAKEGSWKLVSPGKCSGVTAAAAGATERTYALEFIIKGGQHACITS